MVAMLQTEIDNLYQEKKSLDQRWDEEHNKENKYTLNMVKIDREIQILIGKIKSAETELAKF
tara:strand:+ start:193 stop:378 length:186 start_codon:yes stop_codon:yes gene_type:complete